MKKIFSLFFLSALLFLFPRQSIAATHTMPDGTTHETIKHVASDGASSGTLELTPNDPPYAGQTTKLKFDFSGAPKGFTIGKCDCVLEIAEPGRLPSRLPVTLQNESGPDVSYVTMQYLFPATATYKLTLIANPKVEGTFKPFTLSWEVKTLKNEHIVPYTSHKAKTDSRQMVIVGFVIVAVVLTTLIYKNYRRPQKEK